MTTLAAKPSALSWFLNADLMKHAVIDSVRRMTPRYQWRNPVMFVVYVGSILTTILWIQAVSGKGEAPASFILATTLWLSLIHISEPTRQAEISYAVFCLTK